MAYFIGKIQMGRLMGWVGIPKLKPKVSSKVEKELQLETRIGTVQNTESALKRDTQTKQIETK